VASRCGSQNRFNEGLVCEREADHAGAHFAATTNGGVGWENLDLPATCSECGGTRDVPLMRFPEDDGWCPSDFHEVASLTNHPTSGGS
jgi:hypothetical protein